MTETEWLTTDDVNQLLEHVHDVFPELIERTRGQGHCPRKVRLFCFACCRNLWPMLVDPRSRRAVEIAELFADGQVGIQALQDIEPQALEAFQDQLLKNLSSPSASAALWTARGGVWEVSRSALAVRNAQASLIRDIFGNPFRPVEFNSSWHTGTAVQVAQTIYDDRAFNRMPLLADALLDAGCDNADILAHCRSATNHVRGCWVVDLLLGRE